LIATPMEDESRRTRERARSGRQIASLNMLDDELLGSIFSLSLLITGVQRCQCRDLGRLNVHWAEKSYLKNVDISLYIEYGCDILTVGFAETPKHMVKLWTIAELFEGICKRTCGGSKLLWGRRSHGQSGVWHNELTQVQLYSHCRTYICGHLFTDES
jgi:hypothetical protein